MSFNIWSNAPPAASWESRCHLVASVLSRSDPEIIGLQEATVPIVRQLQRAIPRHRWVGVGRENGKEEGEVTPIFFRSDRLALLEHGTFWLAPDPSSPGRGWDAAHSRTVTWARFFDGQSRREFVHLNTHFDHLGRRARRESAALLLDRTARLAGENPAVITGDFNCREVSEPYRILTGAGPFVQTKVTARFFRDSYRETLSPPEGPRRTYRGLMALLGVGRIDYVFVSGDFRVLRHMVLEDRPAASDHRPVLVHLDFAEAGR